ncbi:MAG: hypothetical protein JXA64_04970 [Candidatus Fermentibacteraceae bacterium]|nr:hypothetical protein [Candidatus Fermentibacteraceae bacterium]MBN2608447.1 hypothetical protein [Candidatus Fermentibacteraceae bacterium]
MRRSLTLLASLVPAVLSDSAVMFEFPDGRSVALTSSGDIAMAAESVTIDPAGFDYEPWYDGSGWLPMMDVECVFYLVNESEDSRDVTVGFPIDARFGDAYTVFSDSMLVAYNDSARSDPNDREWYDTGLAGGTDASGRVPPELQFTAAADGELLEVFYRTCRSSLEERMIRDPVVAVWRMHFEPGQTRRLVNTYRTSWDYFGGGPWGDFTVSYILTTGSTWKGPIGDAVITLVVPENIPVPQLSDTLQACWEWSGSPWISGDTVTWTFSDFEPVEDISLTVMTVLTDPVDERVYPISLLEKVNWESDSLLRSAGAAIQEMITWSQQYHSELVLRLLEASVEFTQGRVPPYPTLMHIISAYENGSGYISGEKAAVMMSALAIERAVLEEDVSLVEQAGYAPFLPLFTVKYQWDADDIRMYASQPLLEGPYLELLSGLETAKTGGRLEDPAIDAFYSLTGWYHPGDSSWYAPSISGALEEYMSGL